VKWSRLVSIAALGLLAVGLAGCGGKDEPKYVKVSGTVTLDGKPLADAVVMFAPKSTKESQNPGKSSSGYTDENGHYVLKIANDGKDGALVGTHVVRINMKGQDMAFNPETGSPDHVAPVKQRVNPIPKDWIENGQEFTVPAEGTDKANFTIVTKKK
jgi:hypothetical protein